MFCIFCSTPDFAVSKVGHDVNALILNDIMNFNAILKNEIALHHLVCQVHEHL